MGDQSMQERGLVHSWAQGQAGFSSPRRRGQPAGLRRELELRGLGLQGYLAVQAGLGGGFSRKRRTIQRLKRAGSASWAEQLLPASCCVTSGKPLLSVNGEFILAP